MNRKAASLRTLGLMLMAWLAVLLGSAAAAQLPAAENAIAVRLVAEDSTPATGETVTLAAKPGHVHAFDLESGLRLNDKPVISA